MLGLSLFGVDIIESEYCTRWQQVRFPRSKKSRIREKWKKRRENWGVAPAMIRMENGNTLYAHPAIVQKLRASIKTLDTSHQGICGFHADAAQLDE